MTTQTFTTDTYNRIKETILNFKPTEVSDIYVISFYKSNFCDDPRHPMLTVGYNTNFQWKTRSPSDGDEFNSFIASDADEAKWNFAFWLQNEELVIGSPEYNPVTKWVKQLPFYYTDEEEGIEKADEFGSQIQKLFIDIMISHAKRLHDEGVIIGKFEKPIPIVIHELEYYDVPLNWTKQGNPIGLTSEFEEWISAL